MVLNVVWQQFIGWPSLSPVLQSCFLCVSSGTYHILIQTAVVGMMMMECYPSCLQHQKYWGQRSMTSPVICGPWGSSCTSCKYSNCHMYILQVQQLSHVHPASAATVRGTGGDEGEASVPPGYDMGDFHGASFFKAQSTP